MPPRKALMIALIVASLLACAMPDESRKTAPAFPELTKYKGKIVLLNFWATNCGGCRLEIPWFMEFQKKYKTAGFVVLGVALDEDGWKSVKPFARHMKLNYPVI